MTITNQIIAQHLGTRIFIQYACHTKVGVPVEMGRDFVLFDDGGIVHSPSISILTTKIPRVVKHKPATHLPTDLGDLFK